jgi:hypothetical protein
LREARRKLRAAPQEIANISHLTHRAPDPCIITEDHTELSPADERAARLLAFAAILVGCYAAWAYHQAGLTLSHYDAKAHLVVARRVIDSLTPGWKQIGAVWLPLPHLLNLLPVQVDAFYRTGAFGVALSVCSFGLMVYACARLVIQVTGSRVAATAGILVVALNPDMLYLQSTPMTEPLLLALTTLGITLLARWVDSERIGHRHVAGAVIASACLTRYEAWPLTGAALVMAVLALWRRGRPLPSALRQVAGVAAYPAAAGLVFLFQSRLTVGHWFVTGGFYVPDNPDTGRPFKTVGSIWWASHQLNGYGVLLFAVAGALLVVLGGLTRRARPSALVVLALAATAALPWYAFFIGHPFRFRYMVPLVPALAVYAGCGVGLLPARARAAAAAVLVALVLVETHPFSATAPMVLEAQLDRQHGADRRAVTAYLIAHRRGDGKILASFGSLSHYVQELSQEGLNIRDFVHEGNGDLWMAALASPSPHVDWILVEELAEGGDVLARRARADQAFTAGFRRAAEGGGVALYERAAPPRAARPVNAE